MTGGSAEEQKAEEEFVHVEPEYDDETVLSDVSLRNALLNEIEEATFFVRQRLFELNSEEQAVYSLYQSHNEAHKWITECDT